MKILFLMLLGLSFNAHAYTVHEWGTFTSLVGSDGVRQEGMVYEDEVLPDFVHNFWDAKTNLPVAMEEVPRPPARPRPCCATKLPLNFLGEQSITQKMETPVLYFHSDTPLSATVEVGFPTGIISQAFPKAAFSLPEAIPGVSLTNGFARFEVDVLTNATRTPPAVLEGNIYGHARDVVANTIVSNNEVEKFIFYRGLGKFESKLFITSKDGNVRIQNTGKTTTPRAFLVDTTVTKGAIMDLGSLGGAQVKTLSAGEIRKFQSTKVAFEDFALKARQLLTKALIQDGLNADEAVAMVNTWEHGYFKTPGLRVLYLLSRPEIEVLLPMKITPEPAELRRVFVGRIEVLRDVEEKQILANVQKGGIHYNVLKLGRFAPSIIKRIYQLAKDQGLMDDQMRAAFDHYDKVISENM